MKDLATAAKEISRSEQTKQHAKSLPSTASAQKITQIVTIVRQSFDIQNTYGKTPEQLKTLQKAMVEDLKAYDLDSINKAFLSWRQESANIPTPADIISIIERRLREKRGRQYTPPEGRRQKTQEEKDAFSKHCAEIKKALRGGEDEKRGAQHDTD